MYSIISFTGVFFLLSSLLLLLSSCEDKTDPREKNNYYTYVISPKGEEFYVGKVKGYSSCKYAANAYIRNLKDKDKWQRRCCVKIEFGVCTEETTD